MRAKVRESKEVEDLKNQLARALADYDNLRKRVEKEKENFARLAGTALFIKLIPIFDTLWEAQKHLKDDGLSHVLSGLDKVLEEEGIIKIKAEVGQKFDEKVHEAVEVAETEENEKYGTIAEVVLEGWAVKEGLVIRPAKVKVYGKMSEKKEELDKEMARGEYA